MRTPDLHPPRSVALTAPRADAYGEILSTDAMAFLAGLTRMFRPRLKQLLQAREQNKRTVDGGARLDFRVDTAAVRAADWRVAPVPSDLRKRVVEITGPVDRKMIINALNSGADVFMADFEDATSPSWSNQVEGQIHLRDAVRRDIRFVDASRGKEYALHDQTATLMVRPRGLHLVERHMTVDGEAVPGSLFDFGLFFFHNARELLARDSGPYFYLPKLEACEEARWWNDVFVHAQEQLELPRGTIKATVLIETLPAAFQMDEILYELRDHSAGLNCGRWDYIFSYIKSHRADPKAVLPDRDQVTMEQPFLRAYTQLLVKTCHRRGAHAMGGMAAQIPVKGDPVKAEAALARVRADKRREVNDGHDGTWVAHPGLVPIARDVFAGTMTGDHQLHILRDDVDVDANDLLAVPTGTRTEGGLRHNIRVGIRYLEAWLRGTGCVPLYGLMEDAATAEICRTQIWQWLRYRASLDDGTVVTRTLVDSLIEEEMTTLATETDVSSGSFRLAKDVFAQLCHANELADFLTSQSYELLP